MDEVLNKCSLERKDLDFKCTPIIISRIAGQIIDEWNLIGRELDVAQEKLTSIRNDGSLTRPEEKAIAALDAWADEKGKGATCLKLAEALWRRKKTSVIEILCEEVTQMNRDTTTSGAGAAVSPQPSDYQQQQHGCDIVQPDVEVDTRMNALEQRFRVLHGRIMSELEDKKIPVLKFIKLLRFLPLKLKQEYDQRIEQIVPDLRQEEEVSDLFIYINPLVSFLDYGLTEYIINEFGSNNLKKMMNEYSTDVVEFMKKTTVKNLLDYWPGPQNIPQGYTTLKAKIDQKSETCTLYDVDQLRKRFCQELKLHVLVLKTNGLKMANSFIIEWLVPTVLVSSLLESARQLDFGFYDREHVVEVVVGEEQVFPFLPDSKTRPSLLTQTTRRLKPHVRSVTGLISSSILIVIILVSLSFSRSKRDHFKTTVHVEHLETIYKSQQVVEFRPLDNTTVMDFLNITLKNQSKNLMIDDIDSLKFFNEVDLKYQTEYMQPTNYSDSNEHKSLRIIISGHSGAGKTTLMRHLAKKWAKGEALQACKMLIVIHLDRLTTKQKPESLSQLLELSPLHGQLNVEEVSKDIQKRRGAGVCFLFDSIDKWPHIDDFVHDLFFDSDLRLSLCISTSQQMFSNRSNIMYVNILGFNERDLNDSLHSLTSDQQVRDSIQKLWGSDSDIKDLCKLPLNLVMLIHITNVNIKLTPSIHTKTQLYSEFMYVTIKHNSELHLSGWSLKRYILFNNGSGQSVLPEPIGTDEYEFYNAFQHLHRVAFDMLIHKEDSFPERVEINKNINKFGLVDVTKVESIHNEVKYTFYHPTFVEFFAAIHLLSLPQEERLYLYIKDQQREEQVNHNLWLFFFGLIGEHFNEDDYPNIIRQFAMYHSEQEIEHFPPYCQEGRFLVYMKEIQWKGKKYSKLLSSAGVVANSTLFTPCGDEHFMSFNTLLYTLEQDTNIHILKFNNIGNSKSDIDTLLMLQANALVTYHHLLDILHDHNIQLNITSKNVSDLLYETVTIILSNSASADSVFDNIFASILNLFDQNIQQELKLQENGLRDIFQIMFVPLHDTLAELQNGLSDENYTCADSERNNTMIAMFEDTITSLIKGSLLHLSNAEIVLRNHSIIHVPEGFPSTYIHVPMTLRNQINLHESETKWLNAYSIVDHMLSGDILSKLWRKPMDALTETIVKRVLSLLENQYDLEMIQSMLHKTIELIFHATSEFWKSLKTLLSNLATMHLNNIELSCNDFPKLVDRLKQKKDNVRYIFDLNIDLGMTQDVSDSCQKLMSSFDELIGNNTELKKLTVILPKEYFMTPRGEFIPRQLLSTGLKHLSTHLPESLSESICDNLISEVSEFEKLVTLEIQGCPLTALSNPKLKVETRLPHTLRELTLDRSSLTDEDVKAIVELINLSHELTSLSLPNNYITGSGLNILVGALKSHREFTSLDLSGNPITEWNGLQTLSELNNLRELKLSNCSIGDTEIEILVASLESNSNLHSLNLSGNPFIGTEHGLEPLAWLTNLSHLDISDWPHHSKYGYRKAAPSKTREETLLNVLKNLTQLRFLNLCSESDPPIYWSKEMATIISHLPHLQVFNAPCLSFLEYDE